MLAKQIKLLLAQREPTGMCDTCLARELKIRPSATLSTITEAFGLTSDFARQPGNCLSCGKQDWIIKAGGQV
jgi:hypothetical protein